jgi:hypothetical protein
MWRNLRPRFRGPIIALGVLLTLLLVIRLVLDPLAAHYLRGALASSDQFRGTFSGVHISILPPGVRVRRLKVIELPNGRWENPVFYVEEARVGVVWRQLFHRQLVADVHLDHPKALLIPGHEKKTAKKAKSIGELLREQIPARIDRFEIVGGEALLARGTGDQAPELWIHRADLTAENLATRRALMANRPARLEGSARVQRSGKLTLAFTMNPWTKGLTFNGKAALRDLDLRELYSMMSDRSDLAVTRGIANVFVELHCHDNVLSGGAKPELTDLEVASTRTDLGDKLKALAADAAVHLASHKDHTMATVVPIEGKLSDPHVQLVPAILGVVRNSFIEGISAGFANLPPPVARKKEGVIKQTVKALKKGNGPPEAQPQPSRASGNTRS